MKILLPVDGSDYTAKMLAYVSAHSPLFGPANEYTVLTVKPTLPPRVRAALGKAEVTSYYAEETEKVLTPVVKLLAQQGIDARHEWKIGSAGEIIAQFADAGGFDLLIMGSHGHTSLGNLVMGSVTTEVLAHSKVPVLLVR